MTGGITIRAIPAAPGVRAGGEEVCHELPKHRKNCVGGLPWWRSG